MSLFVPAANCVVTTFLMELDGVLVSVMPSFRKLVPPITIFNLTTFNSAIDTSFVANVLPLLSSDITYKLTQSRRQNVISDIAASTAVNEGEVGEADLSLPSGCAFRLEVVTLTEGRSGRGALYLPGIPKDQVLLNTIDAGWAADIFVAWAAVQADAVSAGWKMVVRSKFVGNLPRPSALVSDATGISYLDRTVDYQRRRKPEPGIGDGDFPGDIFGLD